MQCMSSSLSRQNSKPRAASFVERRMCSWNHMSMLFLRVFLFCWEIKVVKMQGFFMSSPQDGMTSCTCKSCLVLPVKEEFTQFTTIIAFGLFCFYFLDGIKSWIQSVLSWTCITVSDTLFCHVPEIMFIGCLSCSRKAGGYSILWREFSSILWLFEHLLPWVFD